MTRVVLIGARGMLATDLRATAPPDVQVEAFTETELDLTNGDAVSRALDEIKPDWVVNAAAYTRVDRAEDDYDAALAVNGTAVGQLGQLCASRDIRVVHFSTDYVFPGDATRPYRETDAVAPINAYGRTKLAGERGLLASGAPALILRTQWLFGLVGNSFPRTMWERALKRLPTRVVADQVGRPTSTLDLAHAVWELTRQNVRGIYHIANGGDPATWFDVALVVFRAAGADDLLAPCTSAEYPTPAARPAFSVLETTRLALDTGVILPPWRDALARFLDQLAAEGAGAAPRLGTTT